MITVDHALEQNRVEDPIRRAFIDHIGDHVVPYVDVTLMNVRGHHDEVVNRVPQGHGDYREMYTPVYNVSMFVLYNINENTRRERYVGLYDFYYSPTEDSDEDIYQAALDAMIDGDRLLGIEVKYLEGELDDGA